MKIRRSRFHLVSVFAALALACLVGCKKQEDTKNGISGSVTVESGTADGVIVSVFDEPQFDESTVWYTVSRQPSVGFPFSPTAAFDWRDYSPRLSVSTGGNGQFNFDLPDGDYIVVARKEAFGWSKATLVALRGNPVDIGRFTLYPESLVTQLQVTTNTTWLSDHHYIIDGNLIIAAGATLTVQPGAVVRLGDQWRIRVFGGLICEGTPASYIHFTSNDLVDPDPADWLDINFAAGADSPRFSYTSFTFADNAVLSYTEGSHFEKCYFGKVSAWGIGLLAGGSHVIKNSVFDNVSVSIHSVQAPSVAIEHNAIYGSHNYGVELEVIQSGSIYCNWFHNCGRSDSLPGPITGVVFLNNVHNMEIYRNNFEKSWYALALGARVDSTVHIHHNRFQNINRVMDVGTGSVTGGPSFPHFNFNSMSAIARVNVYVHTCEINNEEIDARYNYWNSVSISEISDNMIHDCADDPICLQMGTCVTFQPYVTHVDYDTVGICPN